jgi:hypothetical protein
MRFFSRSQGSNVFSPITFLTFVVALVVGGIFPTQIAHAANGPFIRAFHTVSTIASTIPAVRGGALWLFVVRL